jgi:hypothetical protein
MLTDSTFRIKSGSFAQKFRSGSFFLLRAEIRILLDPLCNPAFSGILDFFFIGAPDLFIGASDLFTGTPDLFEIIALIGAPDFLRISKDPLR